MRIRLITLVGLFIISGCSAAGSDNWEDGEGLAGIEATLGAEGVRDLQDLDDPLAVSLQVKDMTLAPVRVDPGDPTQGPADAPVTLVVFSDYQCPFCGRHEETTARLKEAYGDQLRMVFKQYPLQFHKQARPAARAAIAAGKQGKFWEMHYRIFSNSRSLSHEKYMEWAKEFGLDLAQFETDLASDKVEAQVARDIAAGNEYGVRGTPASFVNGVFVSGAQPYQKIEEAVLLGLKRAYILRRQGVPADEVYETLIRLEPGVAGAPKPGTTRPGYLHEDWKKK